MSIKEAKYDKASMKVVFYDKDLDGLWREVAFAEGALKDFSIDDNYAIVFSGITLEQLLGEAKSNFTKKQEEEIDGNTIIIGNFIILLSSMDRSSRQKISKATEILDDTREQFDLIDIFRIFHPNKSEYIFFSSARGIFSLIGI